MTSWSSSAAGVDSSYSRISEELLFDNFSFSDAKVTSVLNTITAYIVSAKRCDVPFI